MEGDSTNNRNPMCRGSVPTLLHPATGGLFFLTDGQIIDARVGICQYPIINRVTANIRMVPQNTYSSSVMPLSIRHKLAGGHSHE